MGITIFKFVIWGYILLYIHLEIMFYGHISEDIPPQMTNSNTFIP